MPANDRISTTPSTPVNPSAPTDLVLAYPALVSALIAKITVTLTDDERAFYISSIADADALELGTHHEASVVLDECLRMARLALPALLANKVAGYGPLRTRHVLDLAQTLAGEVSTLDQSRVTAAGKSAVTTTSLIDTRSLRRKGLRALKNLAGKRSEEQARIKRTGKGEARPDARARSLEAIATELGTLITQVPPRIAEDAGATPALIAELRQGAQLVLASRSEAQGARGAVGSRYDVMNLLEGRILHELLLLDGALKDARRDDKTVPLVRCAFVRQRNRAKAKPAPTPTPAPAPGCDGDIASTG